MGQTITVECQSCEAAEKYEVASCIIIMIKQDGSFAICRHDVEGRDLLVASEHLISEYLDTPAGAAQESSGAGT